jgi:hypothetical protein
MKILHVAFGLAMAAGLSACETAFSGPMSGQTAFITDGAAFASSPAAGTVTTPESCPDPWPIDSLDRNNGNATPFSDRSLMYEGC